VARCSIKQILQRVIGAELAEQARDTGLRGKLALLFVFGVASCGKIIRQMDDDEVARITGFVVRGQRCKRSIDDPQAPGRGGDREIHGAGALEVLVQIVRRVRGF